MTDRPSPVQRFFGGLLIAVGVLIAALCGLCTMVFMVGSVIDRGGGELFAGGDVFILALVIGGLPTGIGALIAWGGWRLYRPKPAIRPATLQVFSDKPPPDGEGGPR